MLVNTTGSASASDARKLADALNAESDLVVDVTIAKNYAEVLSAICTNKAYVVSLSGLGYLSASAQGCAEAIYITEIDGKTSSQGELITAVGRNIFSVQGIKGYRFCRPNARSVNSWIVPAVAIQAAGLDPLRDLYSVTDTETDEGVLKALVELRCDAGAMALGVEKTSDHPERFIVLQELPPVPNETIAISSRLEPGIKEQVLKLLENHRDDLVKLMGAEALSVGGDSDYADLRALFEEANFDLTTLGQ
jgi:ABC-type phosphate/phosphonate transport system substrate-binding protein